MSYTWDPERRLRSCDSTQRARHTDATRDLLTEPRWGKWEGAPENAPLDARDLRVPIHTARPSRRAQMTVLCGLALVALVVAWMLARGLGWL